MKLKTITTFILIISALLSINGQSLTLEECYDLAEKNFPLVRQYDLIERSEDINLSNVAKGHLPRLSVSGQMTHQSDVVRIPFSMPNMEIPTLSRNQYRVQGEVVQPISDMFTTLRYQRNIVKSDAEVERKRTDVELYQLKERINQLYFGILMTDAQITQVELMMKDVDAAISKNKIAIENGVALKSSADILRAELLKAEQKTIELEAMRTGLAETLSIFIDREIDEHTTLQEPAEITVSPQILRPELQLFEAQKSNIQAKSKMIDAGIMPRLNLFAQGGYGKPALNMLEDKSDFYFIGAVRLSWNISNLYTHRKEKQQLRVNQNAVDLQKDAFLFNLRINATQQNNSIDKYQKIIEKDREIVKLRESARKSAESQLEYGTVTASDYLQYINAEEQAKQNLIFHSIPELAERHTLKTTIGY